MKFQIVFLVLSALFIRNSNATLRCYACSFSSSETDQSCLTINDRTRSVDCPFRYCTIIRQEFLDPAGRISSFMRGCDDHPDHLNHEITDDTFRTFYRACTNDLCNIGNGIEPVVGGNLSPTPPYIGENLLVPGTGGSVAVKSSLFVLVSAMIINHIYRYVVFYLLYYYFHHDLIEHITT
ncbi:uncharacterized protein LOC113228661 [Hyposmocoma kahamanoa]|uniref:uncharacterized protein LOC113228661 n=1 Tax=Hyposmocoma kahamanoa TaxID=1477025 RepID=UPI000E6D72BF|nr:uncharacterized protein LOC113228661 [Hyposmocoma kahamanoa]